MWQQFLFPKRIIVILPLWKIWVRQLWLYEIPNIWESHSPFMFQTTNQMISLTTINHHYPPATYPHIIGGTFFGGTNWSGDFNRFFLGHWCGSVLKWLLLKILAPKHHWFVGNVGSVLKWLLVNDGKYIPSFIQIFGSLGWFKGQFTGHPAKFHGKNHGFL